MEKADIAQELVMHSYPNETNNIEHNVHNISPFTTLLNSKALKFQGIILYF